MEWTQDQSKAYHADCVKPCGWDRMFIPDPILDAEGHNKPLRRRGTFTSVFSHSLSKALGIRCVVYRDWHADDAASYINLRPSLRGSIDYIFVKGYNGRLSTTGLLPPYRAEQDAEVAAKIREALDGQSRENRNFKLAASSVVSAVAGLTKMGQRLYPDVRDQRILAVPAVVDRFK